MREMLIRQRTQLINSIRGHLTEFGIVGPNRAHRIGLLTKLIEDDEFDELPAVARHVLRYLVEQLREVKSKLFRIDRDLMKVVRGSDACRRLMTIPGVGIVTATALVASMRDLQTSNRDDTSQRGSVFSQGNIPRAAGKA
jgi:transposase